MKKLDKPTPPLSVSIVIPVYNEADTIVVCLEAITRQTVRPLEVIVVDNNSNDATAALAQTYPFVRVVSEQKQGVVYARNTGFNAARGDIIGRIDADTQIAPDWVAALSDVFADSKVQAASGRASYDDIHLKEVFTAAELLFRRWLARRMRSALFLYGANMAVRRSVWQVIAPRTCSDKALHEDLDIAIHISEAYPGGVAYDERLRARISTRRLASGFNTIYQYALANPRTYAQHGRREGRFMYPIVFLTILSYPLLGVLHRPLQLDGSGAPSAAKQRVSPVAFRE